LSIDAARAHLVLAGTFAKGRFDVTPLWPAGAAPVLPLSFELRAVDAHADPRASALRATLAAPLMRETAVAVRRVRRGAPLTCDDVVVARIPSRRQARQPLSLPCHVKEGAIALRELGAGDVVDESDIGDANGVLAGEPVDVRLRVGSITVTTTGTALSDARAGEPADVRLRHPTRTLRSRVVARSVVELQEPLQ
jgi:flagella basal body P-ring formation protein FlgA